MESSQHQQSVYAEGAEQKEESQASMESEDVIGTHVDLTVDELHALTAGITMVTQDGTTITVPAHQNIMSGRQQHVAMVTQDGKELQQVAIVTSDAIMPVGSEMSSPQCQQVALLATANGTQIAVQLEEQQTLEEAISMATATIQQGLTQDQPDP